MTSQRRDVSANFYLSIIKSKRGPEFEGIEIRTDESTEKQDVVNQINRVDSCFCIVFFFFSERLRMLYRLIMFISESSMF